jgi:hypothetical protein
VKERDDRGDGGRARGVREERKYEREKGVVG